MRRTTLSEGRGRWKWSRKMISGGMCGGKHKEVFFIRMREGWAWPEGALLSTRFLCDVVKLGFNMRESVMLCCVMQRQHGWIWGTLNWMESAERCDGCAAAGMLTQLGENEACACMRNNYIPTWNSSPCVVPIS
jgi:hypothetical protein